MFLRFQTIEGKTLIGKRMIMSFAQNTTKALWQQFMPLRKQMLNVAGNELYSVEVYPADFFRNFDAERLFEKWAAVEARDTGTIPAGLERMHLPKGDYAVFLHRGPASEGTRTYEYIFHDWLPKSMYRIDDRPHFALMGEKYKPDDPSSEEEIWIPVRRN